MMRRALISSERRLSSLAAWAAPCRRSEPHWPPSLTVGTASPGGTYAAYGEGLARVLTRELGILSWRGRPKGRRRTSACWRRATSSSASSRSASRCRAGTGRLPLPAASRCGRCGRCFRCTTRPSSSWSGTAPASARSADLTGKRVGIGPQGGTSGAYVPAFLKVLKVEPTLAFGDWAELGEPGSVGKPRRARGRRRRSVPRPSSISSERERSAIFPSLRARSPI